MKSSYVISKQPLARSVVTIATTLLVATAASADPITVVSWGGSYGDAQDKALFNDASKNTGIEIIPRVRCQHVQNLSAG